MTDTYQAVYDAVRSKLSNGDIGAAIRDACHLDASHAIESIRQEFLNAASEMQRPSVLYKPYLWYKPVYGSTHNRVGNPLFNGEDFPGEFWIAEYGNFAARGLTPAEAMADFDKKWVNR